MTKKITKNQLLVRYALTGGALGLYFGFFFRPARQPSLLLALGLAFLITVVTMVIRMVRKRPLLSQLLKGAGLTFLKAASFLVLLELRHPVFDYGGKIAVSIFMTAMGMLAGLYYAADLIRQKRKS